MFVREVLLPLLVSSVSKKLLALNSTLLNEALRQPFVDKRLIMAIGVLGNSDGLTLQAAHGFTYVAQERKTESQRRDRFPSCRGGCLHKPQLSPDQRGLTMPVST